MARDQWQADIKARRISHKTLNFQVQFEGVMPAYLAAREDKGMFGIRKTSGAAKAVATGVPAWIKVHATEYVMHLAHE